ncbi:hypothetical protein EAM_0128 [Erwinia amylovora ATCC 49946]|nr:hypothetical protein EAM_0128 [Erwinia amylovora ATCC 49946]
MQENPASAGFFYGVYSVNGGDAVCLTGGILHDVRNVGCCRGMTLPGAIDKTWIKDTNLPRMTCRMSENNKNSIICDKDI